MLRRPRVLLVGVVPGPQPDENHNICGEVDQPGKVLLPRARPTGPNTGAVRKRVDGRRRLGELRNRGL